MGQGVEICAFSPLKTNVVTIALALGILYFLSFRFLITHVILEN